MTIEALYRISRGSVCAGLLARDGIVADAAPALRRHVGHRIEDIDSLEPVSWKITSFDGPHRFLSNFWLCRIPYKGIVFSSTEHAYQWEKMTSQAGRDAVLAQAHPGAAKRAANAQSDRARIPDDAKIAIMLDLLRIKFAIPFLQAALRATGDADLIEGNTWNDVFWGVCRGAGRNELGKLLMQVRTEIA